MTEPPAVPELPDGWHYPDSKEPGVFFSMKDFISLGSIRALLATQGLSICTEADRKVLDASWAIPDGTLAIALRAPNADNWVSLPGSIVEHLKAELSRREKEKRNA